MAETDRPEPMQREFAAEDPEVIVSGGGDGGVGAAIGIFVVVLLVVLLASVFFGEAFVNEVDRPEGSEETTEVAELDGDGDLDGADGEASADAGS